MTRCEFDRLNDEVNLFDAAFIEAHRAEYETILERVKQAKKVSYFFSLSYPDVKKRDEMCGYYALAELRTLY